MTEHVSGSERKTRELLKKANGGVLVVDEVYRLNVLQKARDFGQEVVETLMRYMTPGNESSQNVPAPGNDDICGVSSFDGEFFEDESGPVEENSTL